MIVWLASYPRSGNTLLRIILQQCFGQRSQSLYSDSEFDSPELRQLVGEEHIGSDAQAFLHRTRREGKTLYVKTHELPGNDDHRTIYVVRDGRAALVSHYHYLNDLLKYRIALDDLIAGKLSPSWTDHVAAWAFSGRPNVLVLRYEDLIMGNAKALEALAGFIRCPKTKPFDVSFPSLRNLMPSFFRVGSNSANVAEMSREQHLLFEMVHGKTARRLGYRFSHAADAEHVFEARRLGS